MKRTVTTTRPLRSDAVAIAVHALREPATIRQRCANVADAVEREYSRWWRVAPGKLDPAADFVYHVMLECYPTLEVPRFSCWRSLEVGELARQDELDQAIAHMSIAEQTRSRIDLAVVMTLMDTHAGHEWRYVEPRRGITPSKQDLEDATRRYKHSDGLAIATFRGFMRGLFSSELSKPYRVDADALSRIDGDVLCAIFEANAMNPLTGLEGRARLLRRLGNALREQSAWFGHSDVEPPRPGGLYDVLSGSGASRSIAATDILRALLAALGDIWPADNRIGDTAMGDAWRHPHAGGTGAASGWLPFHVMSQWLTYSLTEPFVRAGVKSSGRDALTALPDLDNGGLLIDTGVILLKDQELATRQWKASDEIVIEWRALTLHFIEKLARRLNERKRVKGDPLTLEAVMHAGTRPAGRELAQELRQGRPALMVDADTLF